MFSLVAYSWQILKQVKMSAWHRLNAATGAQPSGSLSGLKTAATLSELSFTEKNETMLELPYSVKFLVKNINYKSQQILVHDYCLPRQLGMLDLAATPFQFSEELWNYTFFNCSSVNGQDLGWHVPCLDAPGYRVWRVSSEEVEEFLELLPCSNKMYASSLPVDEEYEMEIKNFHLNWITPSHCKEKGKIHFSCS